MDGIIKTCNNNCCEFRDTAHCSVKKTKVRPINIFFSFHVRREEQLRGSPMCSNITVLISGDLILFKCALTVKVHHWATQKWKRKLFKRILWIHLHHVCPSSLVDSFSLSFFRQCPLPCSSLGLCNASYCPIHSINNWEHFMQTVSFGALSSLVTDPWH